MLLGAATALSWKPPKTLTIVISLPPKSATTFGTQILHPACHRNLHCHKAPQVLTHHLSITVSSKNPSPLLSPPWLFPTCRHGLRAPPLQSHYGIFCGLVFLLSWFEISYLCLWISVLDVLMVPLFWPLFCVLLFLHFSLFHVLSFCGFCWKAPQVFRLLEFILYTVNGDYCQPHHFLHPTNGSRACD
jgi:hypothetical protein